jgi:RNA polymerase sigma-70 factor (sigma-E family)
VQGSDGDFSAFVREAWPRLFRTAYALTGQYDDAEEQLQAALTKAYASWTRVTQAETPDAYVRRILVNQVISSARRRIRRRQILSELNTNEIVPGHEQDVTETIAMWAAIRDLPVRQRAVVVLRYYNDLSEREIADAMQISPGTVKSQCSAALGKLKQALTRDETNSAKRRSL